jgi:DNA repair exonuclease SbcCD ATPase subunit
MERQVSGENCWKDKMKIGDLLLLKGFINKKQLKAALSKQAENAINYDKSMPLGKVLIEEGYVTPDDVAEALNDQSTNKQTFEYSQGVREKVMSRPTEIGEASKFTFDLKFLVTIGAVIVSGCGIYFTMNSAIDELKSANSPSRLEYNVLEKEIESIKSKGNLDIITYKLEEYDETFSEIKGLVNDLKPLKSDLEYIKSELDKLKDVEIDIPEVDLSGLENSIGNLSNSLNNIENKLNEYEERLKKVEKGGRF